MYGQSRDYELFAFLEEIRVVWVFVDQKNCFLKMDLGYLEKGNGGMYGEGYKG